MADDVLFITAAEDYAKGKRQNTLRVEKKRRIIDANQHRTEAPRYSRRVSLEEIEKNDFNLNISRYISTAVGEEEIDLAKTHQTLVEIEQELRKTRAAHNQFLKELGLALLPGDKPNPKG